MNYRIKKESVQTFLNDNSTKPSDRMRGEIAAPGKEIFIKKDSEFGKKLKEKDGVVIEMLGDVRAHSEVKMDATIEHGYEVFDHDDFCWKLVLNDIKADVKEAKG